MKNQLKTIKNKKQVEKEEIFDITKFKFLRDLILVKAIRNKNDDVLDDPTQYEDKNEFGEVIKVGDSVSEISVGDKVRFGKYSTELIRTKGYDYFIVHEEDVSAVLK